MARPLAPDPHAAGIVVDQLGAFTWPELGEQAGECQHENDVVVLLDDGLLGFQKHVDLVQFGEHTSAIDFAQVDHAAVARARGADATRVENGLRARCARTTV
jgi:acetolactate synthase I/II/III large subunit